MRIGILGYGQLGRMLAMAGLPLGFSFDFYDPTLKKVFRSLTPSDAPVWADEKAFEQFLNECDIFTYETENTAASLVETIVAQKPMFPGSEALVTTQHRVKEKSFCQSLGIAVTEFHPVHSLSECFVAAESLAFPFVLKTSTQGYDGKGQVVIETASQVEDAWNQLNDANLIAEKWVSFEHECSLIAVRSRLGEVLFYPLVENVHEKGILQYSMVCPNHPQTQEAEAIARKILEAFQYVGVLTIEFFSTDRGLLVNEIAPRVHNSGHWSIEGAMTSQFSNHIRAIAGLSLGETTLRAPFIGMLNILGSPIDMEQVLEIPGAFYHWYGKEPRLGRKLGHVTLLAENLQEFEKRMAQIKAMMR